jgi:hypothetical protein
MEIAATAQPPRAIGQRFSVALTLYAGVTIALSALFNLSATDYVGRDNDDVMRLIEVRDLLSGQSWFDVTQYRLGLEGGTPMHWSRLVDLPIAALVLFFGLFLDPIAAEAAALTVWPLLLIVPALAAMGMAGRSVGGVQAMHIAFGMTALLILIGSRFRPGAIDHHNLQLVLVATLAAVLVEERYRPWSFVIAGLAAALAIAIGAETAPLVAVACAVVAVQWAAVGQSFAPAARAFALSLVGSLSLFFLATVPPDRYAAVTCDSLSLGFYGLAMIGGLLLVVSTFAAGNRGIAVRFLALGGSAAVVAAAAAGLAPQCLRSPLADLDPMLVTLWLQRVAEAHSVLDHIRFEPGSAGGDYVPGLLAIIVCAVRLVRRDRVRAHAVMLGLLVVAWGVALVQVRGAVFANLLSIIPLALLISDLRTRARRDGANVLASLAFAGTVLVSLPTVWFIAGAALIGNEDSTVAGGDASKDCASETALAQLREHAPTTVAAPSNSGAEILRFTQHRVLSAPYHRNQAGMLAELRLGLGLPEEGAGVLREAKVGLVAFCASDPQTRSLIKQGPDGLYAALARGEAPPYLKALPTTNSGLLLYKVDLPRE